MLPLSPQQTRIGWIGLGVMGSSMCGRLLEAGYPVAVHNRTRAKAEPLLARGATWADTPREVAAAADVVFSIVGYPADVREVTLGPCGSLAGLSPGGVLVDMTTSEPALAVEIAAAAALRGVAALDAPVSGGDVGARTGALSIMVGGDRAAFERLAPCWQVMGAKWIWQGPAGAGQHAKIVNQTLIGGNMVGVCEALLYAHRAGLDLNTALESIASGAAGSWSLSNLGPRIIRGDFAPGFYVEHFLKDMQIALQEAARMNLKLPGLELAQRLYQEVAAQGHGRRGSHALMLALARMNDVVWPATGG
ncbi:MAG TPA: NAD(P)-dependent oxidoreductase [Lacipirellulaceae bacterium]|nr:NAD(P)-dependent oxidoreductase [Lacipirellulaceae bacterium]